MTDPKHGGRRPGAGRPLTGSARREPRTVRLPPDVWSLVAAEAKRRGVSATAVIEIAIRTLAAMEGVGDGFP